jgi:3-dehydroquinate synthase
MTVVRLGDCAIHHGRGVLAGLPAILRAASAAHTWAVVADHHVAELHGAALMDRLRAGGLEAKLFTFPAGEWNKTREEWGGLTDRMLAAGIGRDGALLAFGGGVAGDLGGFVAATYMRGIPVVHVPTTLLAMNDASIGGKTGVDVPAGKNLVGAFHSPRAVVADVDLLATLPRNQLAAGLAEAVKHGVIADAGYLTTLSDPAPLLAKQPEALEALVAGSIGIKTAIVSRDERESGERQVLNFGHTVGHAIEAVVGYSLLHGEAVAIGMVAEARLAELLGLAEGLRDELAGILAGCSLPVEVPAEAATDALLEAMARDKKVRAGELRFALPARPGVMARGADGVWTVTAPETAIRRALEGCR